MPPEKSSSGGLIQVHGKDATAFAHLTVEENLLTGAYTRRGRPARGSPTIFDKVYSYFPRLKIRRAAIGRLQPPAAIAANDGRSAGR